MSLHAPPFTPPLFNKTDIPGSWVIGFVHFCWHVTQYLGTFVPLSQKHHYKGNANLKMTTKPTGPSKIIPTQNFSDSPITTNSLLEGRDHDIISSGLFRVPNRVPPCTVDSLEVLIFVDGRKKGIVSRLYLKGQPNSEFNFIRLSKNVQFPQI